MTTNNRLHPKTNKIFHSSNNPVIQNPSFSFFPNDYQLYQNISASKTCDFNNCTVHFHMENQVQNFSLSVNNPRKHRKIIYCSDSSQEKSIINNESLCFLLSTIFSFHSKVVHFTFFISPFRNHTSILATKGKFKNNLTNFCFTWVRLEDIQEILNLNHKKPYHYSTYQLRFWRQTAIFLVNFCTMLPTIQPIQKRFERKLRVKKYLTKFIPNLWKVHVQPNV